MDAKPVGQSAATNQQDQTDPTTPFDQDMDRVTLCKKLKVSSKTLTRWISEGRFPRPMKIGMWERWTFEQVNEWRRRLQEQVRKLGEEGGSS